MVAQIPTAIVGVTGYEGVNLARLVARHPHLRLVAATARAAVGQRLGVALPSLTGTAVADLTIGETVRDAELVFIATPHGVAAPLAAEHRRAGRRVVDISADFRLRDPAQYAHWYGHAHPAPELLGEAVYGLPELRRAQIREARLIANPGCFPTAATLALAPAVAAGLIGPDVIVDAKTGVSGAGRSPSRRVHFSETHDSVAAYGLGGHRHLPEIENELALAAGAAVAPRVTFIPHLVPMNRGILATCYATLRPGVTAAEVAATYQRRYAAEPFVSVIDQPPETGWVRGGNRCLIFTSVDASRDRLVIVAALDNLMKGGAGQAIQNANLCLGLPETAGLDDAGVWP